jgi:UDP-N-acetylglucosamine diphosphorylase/glucosamine-1-phosphate N-acetyltransferase
LKEKPEMNYILFDDHSWVDLLPLTFTRPVSGLRVGILTIREKWERILGEDISSRSQDYLSVKYPQIIERDNILINSSLLPCADLKQQLEQLKPNNAIVYGERILAVRLDKTAAQQFDYSHATGFKTLEITSEPRFIDQPWHIFQINGEEILKDFALITKDRKSAVLSKTMNLINPENIFAEEGFRGEFATINASAGPIYLGKNSEIMEGSVIRGPFALCDNSVVKMAAKIYGPTTIGPNSKVGGEINNSVVFGNSNKAHDGFLGNSVIGEWCNIGADSNNSNLKNNYANVKLWSYREEKFIDTGLTFCGLIMGDHSKCGINTMFNTGTVVGVNANIFGSGFPRNFVPSFSWGGAHGLSTFTIPKAFDVAEKVMSRRNLVLEDKDKAILMAVFKRTEKFRT